MYAGHVCTDERQKRKQHITSQPGATQDGQHLEVVGRRHAITRWRSCLVVNRTIKRVCFRTSTQSHPTAVLCLPPDSTSSTHPIPCLSIGTNGRLTPSANKVTVLTRPTHTHSLRAAAAQCKPRKAIHSPSDATVQPASQPVTHRQYQGVQAPHNHAVQTARTVAIGLPEHVSSQPDLSAVVWQILMFWPAQFCGKKVDRQTDKQRETKGQSEWVSGHVQHPSRR